MRWEPLEGPGLASPAATLDDRDHYRPEVVLRADEAAAALEALAQALAAGDAEALVGPCRQLGLSLGVVPGPYEAAAPAELPSDAEIARVALDRAPDAGRAAPAWLLGPLAEGLDLTHPDGRRVWTAAVAASAFVRHDGDDRAPVQSFLKELRRASRVERGRRAGLAALALAPLAPWEVVEGPGGFGLVPLLPLHPRACPVGPVDLSSVGALRGAVQRGDLVVGRAVACPVGWVVRTAFALPGPAPREVLAGAFVELAVTQRTAARALHGEDLLRRAGHGVVRAAHLHLLARRPRGG